MAYRIISFDGGGMRGLVSALLLGKLEKNASLVKNANMFAGTASGSTLALALAHGINIGHIASLFEQKGEHLLDPTPMDFSCTSPFSFEQQTVLNSATAQSASPERETIKSIFQTKYRADNLAAELGRLFGASRLCELPSSGPQVMVDALQLWSESAGGWAPVSIGSGRNDPFSEMLALDAALCSSATPSYFPPHKPEEPTGKNWGYFAGGSVFANNPSASAISYAVQHFGAELPEIRVLSFGTGRTKMGLPPQDVSRAECWGSWQWMRSYAQHGGTVPAAPLVEAALMATAASCENYARTMLGERFVRADVDLPGPYAVDDWENIAILQEAVEQFSQSDRWNILSDAVAQYWETPDDLALPARAALSIKNKSWLSTLFS